MINKCKICNDTGIVRTGYRDGHEDIKMCKCQFMDVAHNIHKTYIQPLINEKEQLQTELREANNRVAMLVKERDEYKEKLQHLANMNIPTLLELDQQIEAYFGECDNYKYISAMISTHLEQYQNACFSCKAYQENTELKEIIKDNGKDAESIKESTEKIIKLAKEAIKEKTELKETLKKAINSILYQVDRIGTCTICPNIKVCTGQENNKECKKAIMEALQRKDKKDV